MSLSVELISQFAKVTNDKATPTNNSTVYGTIVTKDGVDYVHIDGAFANDGSTILIPIRTNGSTTTVAVQNGDRVIISIRNHMAVVTGNLTTPSTTVEHVTEVRRTISEEIEANYVKSANLDTINANIETLFANDVLISGTLDAQNAVIEGKLDAKVAEITYATIDQLEVHYGEFDHLKSEYASFKETTTKNLTATNADIADLDAEVADINTLMFGSAAGDVIQTSFANAVIAQLGNAQIKSAMIDEIDTNKVAIKSEDGRLVISDETIQISDASRVRVQIGKDASGDYSISVWDEDGNLMFSNGGITDAAIKSAIIRNDMVAPNANISAGKIFVSDENKTLDVAFREMTSEVSEMGETITSQGAEITALKNSITTKVWQQDINTATETLGTQYTELSQDVDSITTTVASHTARLTENGEELTAVQSTIGQLSDSISMLVTDGNGTSLMTQTENGWTFSTSDIQAAVDRTSEALADLTVQCGNTDAAVEVLQQSVSDLGVMAEYIKIGTYEDEPCIELGEGDSNFKLLITNTRILFMDGSDVPAYINNKSLYIKKAVIEEELHQGGWVWKVRSNGNLGLAWKGAAN